MLDPGYAIAIGTLAVGGLVGWGALNERVKGVRKDVDGKASTEIVEHQYIEIITRLDRIEKRINGNAAQAL